MKKPFFLFFYLSLLFFFSSCTGQSTQEESRQRSPESNLPVFSNPFPYQLTDPDTIYFLPPALYEVSALSVYRPGELVMLEDERGIFYVFDLAKGEVIYQQRFAKDDDYEGIEVVGEYLYALKSDGDVFEVSNYNSDSLQTQKFETILREANDTEGMGYDAVNNQLLIACKAIPYLKEKAYKGHKAIYAFDLAADSMIAEPVLLIEKDAIKKYFEAQLTEGQEWQDDKITFNPSAIAIHPILDEIYILASSGKMLISVNRKGEILKAFHLDPRLFKHPEGMCFLPDGTLFISNEGDAGRPDLLKFSMHD